MPELISQTLEPTLQRSELEAEPEVDTVAVDAPEEFQYSFDIPPAQQERLSPEEYIAQAVQGSVHTFDDWLYMKVKDELTVQLFEGNLSVKTARIAKLIEEEAAFEQMRHTQDAQCLNKERTTRASSYDGTLPIHVAQRDIENLRQQEMVHTQMVAFIANLAETGDDWARKLTYEYIERTKADAYKEAQKLRRIQAEVRAPLS